MKRNRFSLTNSLFITIGLTLVIAIVITFVLINSWMNSENQALEIASVVVEGQQSEAPLIVQSRTVTTDNTHEIWLDLFQSGESRRIIIQLPTQNLKIGGRRFWVALLCLSGLGLLVIVFITRRFISPLNQLALEAEQLAKGYLNQPIHVQSSGEVLALAQVLDNMRLQFRYLMSGAVSKAMVWEGKLEFLALSQLITILRVTKRTGAVMIQGPGQVGVIYVDHGEVTGARFRDLDGDVAFWVMFRWETGYFKFSQKMKPEREPMSPWYKLMLEGARRVSSLRLIEGYIPSMDFQPEVSSYPYEEQVHILLSPEKKLLDLIDGNHSVLSLAEKLQWTPEKAQRYLYRLAVIGLVECDYLPQEETQRPIDKIVNIWKYRARER